MQRNLLKMQIETSVSSAPVIDAIVMKVLRGEDHLSFSSLSAFAESPADFIAYKLKTRETTPAMQYGAMVHCLVLEPQDFYNRYWVLDDVAKCIEIGGAKPRATSAYKSWIAAQRALSGCREIVTGDNFMLAKGIATGIRKNRAARAIYDMCPIHEEKIQWEYLNYKFRGIKDGNGAYATFDLKTCPDATPNNFKRVILNDKHYVQAAMYLHEGGDFDKPYYIIAADQKQGISVHQLSKNLINKGRKEYEYLVNKFSECILTDNFESSYDFFSDRPDGIFDVDVRPW